MSLPVHPEPSSQGTWLRLLCVQPDVGLQVVDRQVFSCDGQIKPALDVQTPLTHRSSSVQMSPSWQTHPSGRASSTQSPVFGSHAALMHGLSAVQIVWLPAVLSHCWVVALHTNFPMHLSPSVIGVQSLSCVQAGQVYSDKKQAPFWHCPTDEHG